MPELTRPRASDAREECWHVFYGDVRVGTIAIRTGMPAGEDPWGWACGFYPGSHPGECTDGTAATFERARADFEAMSAGGDPPEYSAAVRAAIDRGYMTMHPSGGYLSFTQAGADLFA